MVEFMITLVLGNIFVMAIMLLLLGFMFVLRVMLNIWFDTDFFKKLSEWFRKTNERYKAKKKVEEEESHVPIFIDEDIEDDH